ncbi:MAG: MoxR family ATPase [Hydrogenophaga sp.]|jgi:MoxR-like ATPase|nr:MoxR family ATPase [Hydrogenophaga sp.]
MTPATQAELQTQLSRVGYLPDPGLSTTVWLATQLQRPVMLEGDAGVGKTALALALSKALQRPLVRLQCFEGLDMAQAAYEWNYGKQLMAIRLHENADGPALREADLFTQDYLLSRPLLKAMVSDEPVVLLIDEVDRADEAFEAFLLEVLAENQITVPELGTLVAKHPPLVVLTSNGTRELSDALRRRCLYHYLEYPTLAREIAIVKQTLPEVDLHLAEEAVALVHRLRREDLAKTPGIAETLDWVRALHALHPQSMPQDIAVVMQAMACLLKTREDAFMLSPERLQQLIERTTPSGVAISQAATAET